jgi:hypothetical protein
MKTSMIIIATLALAFVAESVSATGSPYVEAMQKNIHIVYTSDSVAELQQGVNALERIGEAEKDKWEPYYYAAFGYLMMANREGSAIGKDQYLDQAVKAINNAKKIKGNESELVALEGFVHMMRVTVDPGTRGPQYSGMAMQTLGQACAMDPENPRALALLAQMQFGTAKFFGSPLTEACATANKAMEKFDSFSSTNPLAPGWGKEMTIALQEGCK